MGLNMERSISREGGRDASAASEFDDFAGEGERFLGLGLR